MRFVKHTYLILGITPLLTHNPASMKPTSSLATRKKIIPTPEQEAVLGLYKIEGGFGVPGIAFRSALLHGCKGFKVGKVGAASVIAGAVTHIDEFCLLLNPETKKPLKDYEIDSRRVVIQGQGIIRSRPKFSKWACHLVFEIDEDQAAPEMVLTHLNEGGMKAGVGDYRPQKMGWFGKFQAKEI